MNPIENDPDLLSHIEHQAGSDYQEYLSDYIGGFGGHRVTRFCQTEGDSFPEMDGPEVRALAKLAAMPWDTDCLGLKVSSIAALFGDDMEAKHRVLERAIRHARRQGRRLLTSRIGYGDLSSLHALEESGFRIVDAMNILLWDRGWEGASVGRTEASANINIKEIDAEDENARQTLHNLSKFAFRDGRVARDRHFTKEQVGKFYGTLFDSCIEDPDAQTLVAEVDGSVAGFITGGRDEELSIDPETSVGYLKLIAVDEQFADIGVGRALVRAFISLMGRQVRFVEVGTQIDNCSALGLYSRCGFRPVASLFTLHLWL